MKLFCTLIFCCCSLIVKAQNDVVLTVEFENIKSKTGTLFIALYNEEAQFLKTAFDGTKVPVKDGKATATFNNLAKGVYAISAFYDKNNNGQLDTNFLGIPKEPTAMSNNAKGSFGPPKFKDAKFIIDKENKNIKIEF